jgi:hypothetical protein
MASNRRLEGVAGIESEFEYLSIPEQDDVLAWENSWELRLAELNQKSNTSEVMDYAAEALALVKFKSDSEEFGMFNVELSDRVRAAWFDKLYSYSDIEAKEIEKAMRVLKSSETFNNKEHYAWRELIKSGIFRKPVSV